MKYRVCLAAVLLAAPAAVLAEDGCTLPGILLTDDAGGDSPGVVDGGGGESFNATDIQALSVAEPASMANRLVFTVKVADLANVPPQHRWQVYFTPPDGDERYVAMSTTDSETPTFEYGDAAELDANQTVVGQAIYQGDLDAASNFAADGTITLVVDPSLVGAGPGAILDNVHVKTRATSPNETSHMGLTMDDAGLDAGIYYQVVGNGACSTAKTLDSGNGLAVGALSWLMLAPFAALAGLRSRRNKN